MQKTTHSETVTVGRGSIVIPSDCSNFHQVHESLLTWLEKAQTWLQNRSMASNTQKCARHPRQWHQFMAVQKEFLQYSSVSLTAITPVLSSKIIRAPCCSEPHVNRQKELAAVVIAHTHAHILLCFWLALNQRAAGDPVFPSKQWLSAASSIREP